MTNCNVTYYVVRCVVNGNGSYDQHGACQRHVMPAIFCATQIIRVFIGDAENARQENAGLENGGNDIVRNTVYYVCLLCLQDATTEYV